MDVVLSLLVLIKGTLFQALCDTQSYIEKYN